MPSNIKKANPIMLQYEFSFTETISGPLPPYSSIKRKAKTDVVKTPSRIIATAKMNICEKLSSLRTHTSGL